MRGYPGLRTDLVTYPSDRIAQVMAGQKDDLVVRVYGADLTCCRHKASADTGHACRGARGGEAR